MDRPRDAAREVRLVAGGPPPEDWDSLSTHELQLRWLSALSYANRASASAPSAEAGAALLAIVEVLDRRRALLPEVGTGSREVRLAAAGQRLHLTGLIAHSAGMSEQLRDLTRDDAASTVRTVLDEHLAVHELLAAGATSWTRSELQRMLDDAHGAVAASASVEAAHRSDGPPAPTADAGGAVVDISRPHSADPRPAERRLPLAPDPGIA